MKETDPLELSGRFRAHPVTTAERAAAHDTIRHLLGDAALIVNSLVPEGREKALALTNLEQASMWANAGIARAGQ